MKKIKCVQMTIKEAAKIMKEDAQVLVCISDLESDDCNNGFEKKKFCECQEMIKNSKTAGKVFGDIADQLRVFSEVQTDIIDYEPVGQLGKGIIWNINGNYFH